MKLSRSLTLPDHLAAVVIGCYFVLGLFITGHYGVNWDDNLQREGGIANYSFITNTDKSLLLNSVDRYHGPAFEILMIAIEKGLHLTDSHAIYLSRHYAVFVFFTSVLIAFFLFCRRLFGSSWLGLLGLSMLLLSPRIFAESFYNPKDIVFLGAMIWAMYSLLLFVESQSLFRTVFHAFACAFAVDVRLVGILMVFITLALLGLYVYNKKISLKHVWLPGAYYLVVFFSFMILMWPILALGPFTQFWLAYQQMSTFPHAAEGFTTYMGHQVKNSETPWHYHWVWILITTPAIYSLFFISGTFIFLSKLLRQQSMGIPRTSILSICLFFFFFPLVFGSISHSVFYDGWRHVYFVYPFLIILAVYGVSELSSFSNTPVRYLTIGVITLAMCDSLITMTAMHPFEFIYFNHIANALFKPIDQNFEMDYWGVSYKQGLEYLIAHSDGNEKIKVIFGNAPGYYNVDYMIPQQQAHFELVSDFESAHYFLTNYRTSYWVPAPGIYDCHHLEAQGNKVLAGEASGDLHGANLIRALRARDPQADIRCWGGDRMAAAGGHVVRHIRDLAFMGFLEVIRHLPTILGNISFCKQDILAYRPDVVILIDYPGFNFRLFKFIKEHHFRLFYYISPQLWAWRTGRVKQVKQYVDRMFVIFPFEKEFYAKHGVEVDFVGHPLLDELGPTQTLPKGEDLNTNDRGDQWPGPGFLSVYRGAARVEIEWDNTYGLLNRATAALVTSGTATLETALHGVPEVVCYRSNPLSYLIARQLIKGIDYICIVNLIANKKIVTELIQDEVNTTRLQRELAALLDDSHRAGILSGYKEVKKLLGEAGASDRAADLMLGYLKK
ncbi:unnamed protein product [Sphagnum balticum]